MSLTLPLEPADIGRRISLRIRTPSGQTDVVGTLIDLGPTTLAVKRADGVLTNLARTDVVAFRRVPPSPAVTVSPVELGRIAALGWRALETEPLGEWQLRSSRGATKRANSTLTLGDPGMPLVDAAARIKDWYDARGLRSLVMVHDGSAADLAFDGLGWAAVFPVRVMTSDIAPILRAFPSPTDHVSAETPSAAWLEIYGSDETLADDTYAVMINHPAARFVSIEEAGEPVAVARVSVDGRWAGLFAVAVHPSYRGRGLGRAVTLAALREAVKLGARRCYLQVLAGNDVAQALYAGLGFEPHHSYVYRAW